MCVLETIWINQIEVCVSWIQYTIWIKSHKEKMCCDKKESTLESELVNFEQVEEKIRGIFVAKEKNKLNINFLSYLINYRYS